MCPLTAQAVECLRLRGDRYQSELETLFDAAEHDLRVVEVPIPRTLRSDRYGTRFGGLGGKVSDADGSANSHRRAAPRWHLDPDHAFSCCGPAAGSACWKERSWRFTMPTTPHTSPPQSALNHITRLGAIGSVFVRTKRLIDPARRARPSWATSSTTCKPQPTQPKRRKDTSNAGLPPVSCSERWAFGHTGIEEALKATPVPMDMVTYGVGRSHRRKLVGVAAELEGVLDTLEAERALEPPPPSWRRWVKRNFHGVARDLMVGGEGDER